MKYTVQLQKSGTRRVLSGHPWVYDNEIHGKLPPRADGSAVVLQDAAGRLLGSGLWNSRSKIIWRRFSRERAELDAPLIEQLLAAAVQRRKPDGAVCSRLVWSESDSLPGLIVDRYGDLLAVQVLTLGMEQRLEVVLDVLQRLLTPREIVLRNDAPVRNKEGLPRYVKTVSGKPLEPFLFELNGISFTVDPVSGQKTGLYLDQQEQYALVAAHAGGRRVLDSFCHQGAFALHCAAAGAVSVTAVESSAEAVQAGRENAARNGLTVDFIEANVFDYLPTVAAGSFDLVILDPPPFAKGKKSLDGALRGYKELNLRAMRALARDGVLATYSCSHHVDWQALFSVVRQAAADAGREAEVLDLLRQPADHPVLLSMPESEYLRGLLLRLR